MTTLKSESKNFDMLLKKPFLFRMMNFGGGKPNGRKIAGGAYIDFDVCDKPS